MRWLYYGRFPTTNKPVPHVPGRLVIGFLSGIHPLSLVAVMPVENIALLRKAVWGIHPCVYPREGNDLEAGSFRF